MKSMSAVEATRVDPRGREEELLAQKKIPELKNELGSYVLSSSCAPIKYTQKQDIGLLSFRRLEPR
jgi:hypothetical protein